MSSKNQYIIKNFITDSEANQIINWIDTIDYDQDIKNHHISEVAKHLNGKSFMFDLSNTEITNYITSEQSGENVICSGVPDIISNLVGRIATSLNIPKDNVFLQAIYMNKGGVVKPHYDVGLKGYINYKCNISVLSEDYVFVVDGDKMNIQQKDLYCFEASLFKHWTEKSFDNKRILLSFGFVLPYSVLGKSSDDPRVRLSNRLEKYFQKK
jgi:hypothetical protein